MEDTQKETTEQEIPPTPTPEETDQPEVPEPGDEVLPETDEPEATDIDYGKELERLESEKPQTRSEKEKAEKALFFNARRVKELGGDPAKVIGINAEESEEPQDDVRTVVSREVGRRLAEDKARGLAKSDAEYKLIMWFVDNRNLDVEDAYFLANKRNLPRIIAEAKRSSVPIAGASAPGRKVRQTTVPQRPEADVRVLASRGLHFNPKTNTYVGKYTEEYYDHSAKAWVSRKLKA